MKLAALFALLILLTSPAYIVIGELSTPFTEPLMDWLKIFGIAVFVVCRARYWDNSYKLGPAHA